jgi:C-terminal processing protease CtpA/Prc
MIESYSAFVGNVSGNTTSFGFDFSLYYADATQTNVIAVVNFTYADSPASKAGIKRGDVIVSLNGTTITIDNYMEVLTETLLSSNTTQLGMKDGKKISLTPVQMYENPVQTVRTIDLASGKKVGYLHYASFTLDSCADLETAFGGFREAGIDELVLDLRYNGGGYVTAGTALASMIAPLKEVQAGSIFNKDIYNALLTEAWGESTTPFEAEMTINSDGKKTVIHPASVNPDLSRLWVITGSGTASASESLICGLKPYMKVVLVGDKTAGKFCGGFILDAKGWYETLKENKEASLEINFNEALTYCGDWGIYVMVSRYTDRDGKTLSMPDGIAPDIAMTDHPADGYDLGDPKETILSAVLNRIEGKTKGAIAPEDIAPEARPLPWRPTRPGRILVR